jgi:hypothetical protein
MTGLLQLKLEMMIRLLDFLRAYPLEDEQAAKVVALYEQKVARLRALVTEQRLGLATRAEEGGRRQALRRAIIRGPYRHLMGIGSSLVGTHSDVAANLRQPVNAVGKEVFLGSMRAIEATVQAQHDLFRSNGMAEETSQELATLLAEYEQAVSDANAGRRAHTGAQAEIKSLSRELRPLIRQLDSIVVYHFRSEPNVVGAWTSARNVAWPLNEPVKPAVPAKVGVEVK